MKFSIAMMLVSILGIGGILYTTIMNAEVSGYGDVHGCWGECYEEYTAEYGTFSEKRRELQCRLKLPQTKVQRYMLTVICVMV